MILEGVEVRFINEYRKLKEKERGAWEKREKAEEAYGAAYDGGDAALLREAEKNLDHAREDYKKARERMEWAALSIMNLILKDFEQGKCIDEKGRSI